MLSDKANNDQRSPVACSRVTNGKRLRLFGDGRSAGARRYRDLIMAFGDEAGGFDRLNASGQQMVRRLAQVSVELELLEATRADGGDIDPIAYCTLVNSQRRLLSDLERLKAATSAPAPSLSDYVKDRVA